MTMHDPLQRFVETSGARGAAQARLISSSTDALTGVVTSKITTPALTLRQRWVQVQSPSGNSCIDEDDSAEVTNVESVLAGPAIAYEAGDLLTADLIAGLVADPRYPNIKTSAAAQRSINAIAGAVFGIADLEPDTNMITRVVDEVST